MGLVYPGSPFRRGREVVVIQVVVKADDPAAGTVDFVLIFVVAVGFKFYLVQCNPVIVILLYLNF